MQQYVDYRKPRYHEVPVKSQQRGAKPGNDALPEVEMLSETSAEAGYQRKLSCCAVRIAVAVVIHHQQGVHYQCHGSGQHHCLPIERTAEHQIGAACGDVAEEEVDQHIAQTMVTAEGGVEEGSPQYRCHNKGEYGGNGR